MFSQDYLSYEPESGSSTPQHNSTRPLLLARKPSSSSNTYLRELLGPTTSLSAMSPSCRTIGSPHWGRFTTALEQVTPAGELKASDLLRDRGMTSTYNPPTDEWCYLGADQPEPIPQHIPFRVQDHRKRKRGADMSWAAVSEQDDGARLKPTTAPMQFFKQAPRQVNSSSKLTASFETNSKKPTLAEELAFEGLNCEKFPSAFDSDDEGECRDMWDAR